MLIPGGVMNGIIGWRGAHCGELVVRGLAFVACDEMGRHRT